MVAEKEAALLGAELGVLRVVLCAFRSRLRRSETEASVCLRWSPVESRLQRQLQQVIKIEKIRERVNLPSEQKSIHGRKSKPAISHIFVLLRS